MKTFHRFTAVLLCVLMLLSLSTAALAAGQNDDGDRAVYVLHYDVSDDGYSGPNLQYFSPYRLGAVMDGEVITMKNCLFSLYNTLNDKVIPVYCTDINVLAKSGSAYRRLNLEDSSYAADAAGQIRAIMNAGFYPLPIEGETDAEHATRVAQILKELGDAAGVEDLTPGEAITGTQAAIWQAAHGSALVITDFVHSMYLTDVSDSVRYYDICNEERINGHVQYRESSGDNVTLTRASDAYIGSRIKAVYDYLLSQEPMAPTDPIVSYDSFLDIARSQPSKNADGTYNISITTTVYVKVHEGDNLTLTATMDGGYQTSTKLTDGTQTLTLTLKNIPADKLKDPITLTIDGMQSGFDVYLYDAYGDRESSQSMVGKTNDVLPVSVTVDAGDDRVLRFVKTTRVADGTNSYINLPLEGITFDIYLAATTTELATGAVVLPEASKYPIPAQPAVTVTTGQDGTAEVNLTLEGLPDGAYLVVERDHPAIEAPIDPFYVFMPTTGEDGSTLEYQVTLRPKNDVKSGIDIEKDVTSLGNNSSTVDAYDNHIWIISASVPEDIANGKSYIISDTLDNRLDYLGNLKVAVESADGETVVTTLTEGEDYTLQVIDADSVSKNKPSDSFTVSLTAAGMTKVGNALAGKDFSDYKLRVYFDAQINANAQVGQDIPNQATLDYTNSVNFDYREESDEPIVNTGGVKLEKVDASNHASKLSGATFEVYRYATADEVAAGSDQITHIKGVSGAVVKCSFFATEDLTGEKVTSVTSDDNGSVKIYGLAYGEYFLLETQAPSGYNLIDGAVKLTIDANSHMDDNVVTVENFAGSTLPSTGGMGVEILYFAGILLMGTAVCLLLNKKRKAC